MKRLPPSGAYERTRDNLINNLERRLSAAEASAVADVAALTASIALKAPITTVKVVDSVLASTATHTASTVNMPIDDTVPQSSEGVEIITATITPKSATNKIRIRLNGYGSAAVAMTLGVALFRNSDAGAIAAHAVTVGGASFLVPIGAEFEDAPASVAAQTYKIRAGGQGGTNWTLNGNPSGRLFGGVSRVTLILDEILG